MLGLWSLNALWAISGVCCGLLGVTNACNLDAAHRLAVQNPQLHGIVELYSRLVEFQNHQAFWVGLVYLLLSILCLVAAVRMWQFKSYRLALTGVIISVIPCTSSCCCLLLPIGIWSLVVLSNAQVRQQFT